MRNSSSGKTWIWIVTILAALLLFGGGCAAKVYGVLKKEVQLRNQYHAKTKNNKEIKGTVFKILTQKSSVLQKYSDDFNKNFTAIMAGKYGGPSGEPALMKWISSKDPDYSVELYKDLAVTIEGQQTRWEQNQKMLHDIKLQHDNLLDDPIAGLFLKGKEKLPDILVVTAKAAQEYETGVDSDTTGLF